MKMKKFVVLLILTALLVSLASVSFAAGAEGGDLSDRAFGFRAFTNGSTLTHADQWHTKTSPINHIIEVRHHVTGNGNTAGFTNYIYACFVSVDALRYTGAKWQAPDSIYHSCTSADLEGGMGVVPGGRANTKYSEQLSLSSIQIDGQFRPH